MPRSPSNAMKWVPILNVVLTVVFYAMFPVIFPLFLMPKTGPLALRGYVTGSSIWPHGDRCS
jgi:conjugal transfer mating pair stabilization protein TraG